jgi:hypothetical protein
MPEVLPTRDREAEGVVAMIAAPNLPGFERPLAELRERLQRGQIAL